MVSEEMGGPFILTTGDEEFDFEEDLPKDAEVAAVPTPMRAP
jgi:hypothetical protein